MLDKLPAGSPHGPAAATRRRPRRIKWRYAAPIIILHLVALLALMPWFFSWTGVVLAAFGCYVFGTLGVNIGYHRLLTHRGFCCPLWLERLLALLGVCCLQESPTVWVATHRRHHHVSDEPLDPHSPLGNALWGHIGWLVVKSPNAQAGRLVERYAKDLTSDRFYAWLEAGDNWAWVASMSWLAFFALGYGVVAVGGGTAGEAVRFGSSLVVWGVAVRTVAVWHLTWAVNSVTHLWGYRTYDTPDNSRNNMLVGLLTNGEGWHNNHHADPRSARHGHNWREPDLAWLTIRALMAFGLATNVAVPSPHLAAALKARAARACAGGAIPPGLSKI